MDEVPFEEEWMEEIPDELKGKMHLYADKVKDFVEQTLYSSFIQYILSLLTTPTSGMFEEEREIMPITIDLS